MPLRICNHDRCGKLRKLILADHLEFFIGKVWPDRLHHRLVSEEEGEAVEVGHEDQQIECSADHSARACREDLLCRRPLWSRNKRGQARRRRRREEKMIEVEARGGRRERPTVLSIVGSRSAKIDAWRSHHHLVGRVSELKARRHGDGTRR